MKYWYKTHPYLFHKKPYDRPGCDTWLMRDAHMRRVSRMRSFCVTSGRDMRHRLAPDLVNWEFVATDISKL